MERAFCHFVHYCFCLFGLVLGFGFFSTDVHIVEKEKKENSLWSQLA
jgi:hypothetical protein